MYIVVKTLQHRFNFITWAHQHIVDCCRLIGAQRHAHIRCRRFRLRIQQFIELSRDRNLHLRIIFWVMCPGPFDALRRRIHRLQLNLVHIFYGFAELDFLGVSQRFCLGGLPHRPNRLLSQSCSLRLISVDNGRRCVILAILFITHLWFYLFL